MKTIKAGDKCPVCGKTLIGALVCSDSDCGFMTNVSDYKIPGQLNTIQIDLLSSFLVGHWKEISESEHRVAFERILEVLNPEALKAVRNLAKRGRKN